MGGPADEVCKVGALNFEVDIQPIQLLAVETTEYVFDHLGVQLAFG